jgi:hypothetical protein
MRWAAKMDATVTARAAKTNAIIWNLGGLWVWAQYDTGLPAPAKLASCWINLANERRLFLVEAKRLKAH